jgi:hypothetical protein
MPQATKLSKVCIMLADLMGEIATGTPDGTLATNTFADDALSHKEDDYFKDWFGRTFEGTHRGTNFVISDFVSTSGVVTVKVALATAYDASDKFYMLQDYTVPELINAINLSVSMVEEEALEASVDENILTVSGVYEYDVPQGMYSIEYIVMESGTTDRYSFDRDVVDPRHWTVLNGPEPKIWFDDDISGLTSGRNLRVIGQKVAAQLPEDDDDATTQVALSYLIHQAKANLHFSHAAEIGDAHALKMDLAQKRADMERPRLAVSSRGIVVNE